MLLADYSFGQGLLTVLEVFIFFAWIMVLFTVLSDLFRDHEMGGGTKAVWIVFLIFIPFLGVLVYLLTRGGGMQDRALKEQAAAQKHMDEYIKQTAGTSKVDELASLAELHDKGKV